MSTGSVWCLPACASSTAAGHEVLIETGAGNGIGVDDAQYRAAGAAIAAECRRGLRSAQTWS